LKRVMFYSRFTQISCGFSQFEFMFMGFTAAEVFWVKSNHEISFNLSFNSSAICFVTLA